MPNRSANYLQIVNSSKIELEKWLYWGDIAEYFNCKPKSLQRYFNRVSDTIKVNIQRSNDKTLIKFVSKPSVAEI